MTRKQGLWLLGLAILLIGSGAVLAQSLPLVTSTARLHEEGAFRTL